MKAQGYGKRSHLYKKSLIAGILAEGSSKGEFSVQNNIVVSETILQATALFDFPVFINKPGREEMERPAKDVIRLLIKGLEKK